MFKNLSDRMTKAFKTLRGQSRFTEENMQTALREVRISLIEADVALPVIKQFVENVKQKALGEEVHLDLKPEQALIKIVHEELVHVLGDERQELDLKTQPPAVILMAGLQGSGKTTSAAKLALHLKETGKNVYLVSVDTYRPAAIDQLQALGKQIGVDCFETNPKDKPVAIAKEALALAKKQFRDVVIFDTAGRLHVDADMMDEIKELHKNVKPIETLFVVDSMTGQDAVNTAKAFHEALPLTGIILTKTDGDARGGAALSIKMIIGKAIKFLGSGEKIEALEPFYPDRIASRILDMGDLLTLIEDVERKTDKQAAEKLKKKLSKGSGFDLEDFRQQLLQMNNLGGISGMMSKLPGMGQIPQHLLNEANDKKTARTIAIINSMTQKERRIPKIIIGSRKKRIAQGSGTSIQDVNSLLKQYEQMLKMMKKFSKPGAMGQMMRKMGGALGMGGMGGLGGMPGLGGLKDLDKLK